jgi:ABC-type amino acid transport substrate-binding protein
LYSNKTDVLDALKWAEAHPRQVGAIVARANKFALTYTTYYARVLYWVYALHAYRDLVEGQDEYFATGGASVREYVAEHARQRQQQQRDQQQQREQQQHWQRKRRRQR